MALAIIFQWNNVQAQSVPSPTCRGSVQRAIIACNPNRTNVAIFAKGETNNLSNATHSSGQTGDASDQTREVAKQCLEEANLCLQHCAGTSLQARCEAARSNGQAINEDAQAFQKVSQAARDAGEQATEGQKEKRQGDPDIQALKESFSDNLDDGNSQGSDSSEGEGGIESLSGIESSDGLQSPPNIAALGQRQPGSLTGITKSSTEELPRAIPLDEMKPKKNKRSVPAKRKILQKSGAKRSLFLRNDQPLYKDYSGRSGTTKKIISTKALLKQKKEEQSRGIASVSSKSFDKNGPFIFHSMCRFFDDYEKRNGIKLGVSQCPSQ